MLLSHPENEDPVNITASDKISFAPTPARRDSLSEFSYYGPKLIDFGKPLFVGTEISYWSVQHEVDEGYGLDEILERLAQWHRKLPDREVLADFQRRRDDMCRAGGIGRFDTRHGPA